ncbi:MAG: hypothetical protein LBI53_05440 [Candidatus Peribacteria bacterium]|nr:hypothetical protein [Candidatus Peribacteria bacterium]
MIQDLLSKKLDLVEGIEKILNEEIFPSIQKETVKKLYLQFVYETLSKDELLYLLPILL